MMKFMKREVLYHEQTLYHLLYAELAGRKDHWGYFNTERGREYIAKYEQFHDRMDAKACMFGRVTFMDWPWQLAPGNKPELPENVPHIDRTDYVADVKADKYCIAIDQSGKLAWGANVMLRGSSDIYRNRVGDHIISVLTEKVSDAYLQ